MMERGQSRETDRAWLALRDYASKSTSAAHSALDSVFTLREALVQQQDP
jgi:hypothetical protein